MSDTSNPTTPDAWYEAVLANDALDHNAKIIARGLRDLASLDGGFEVERLPGETENDALARVVLDKLGGALPEDWDHGSTVHAPRPNRATRRKWMRNGRRS